MEAPKAGDGWIEHDGDHCPVKEGTLLEVRYRDGGKNRVRALWETMERRDGQARFWITSDRHRSDIMAYRVVKS